MVEPQEFEGSKKALDSYFSQLLDNEKAVQDTHEPQSDTTHKNSNDSTLESKKTESVDTHVRESKDLNSVCDRVLEQVVLDQVVQEKTALRSDTQFFSVLLSQIIVNRLQKKLQSFQSFSFANATKFSQLLLQYQELNKDLDFYYRHKEESQQTQIDTELAHDQHYDSKTAPDVDVCEDTDVCTNTNVTKQENLSIYGEQTLEFDNKNFSNYFAGDQNQSSTTKSQASATRSQISTAIEKVVSFDDIPSNDLNHQPNNNFNTSEALSIPEEKPQHSFNNSKLLPVDYAERNQNLQKLLTQSFLQTPVETEASTLTQTLVQEEVVTKTEQIVTTKVEPVVDIKVEQNLATKTVFKEQLDLKTQDDTALAVKQAEIMLAKLGVNLKETTSIADQLGIKAKPRPNIREYFEWAENGRPKWAQDKFDIFLFEVNGVTMAVPLVTLGQIYRIGDKLTPIFGQANWMMGIMQTQTGRVKTIDTSLLLMPERYNANCKSRYKFVITIDQIPWGFAVDKVDQPFRLDPSAVNWRSVHEQRPWFAGMIKEKMCTLIDIPNLGKKVLESEKNALH